MMRGVRRKAGLSLAEGERNYLRTVPAGDAFEWRGLMYRPEKGNGMPGDCARCALRGRRCVHPLCRSPHRAGRDDVYFTRVDGRTV